MLKELSMANLTKFINIHDYSVVFRLHATKRMIQRKIQDYEVYQVLNKGDIIESYDDDLPFPSVLINGLTQENRHLHLVVAINKDEKILIIITVYEPDKNKWINSFSKRK